MTSTPTPAPLTHVAAEKYIFYTHPTSPYTQRVHIALNYLEVPYEAVEIDLKKPREAWYLELNPLGQVPALSLPAGPPSAGKVRATLAESGVIVAYLAEAFPKPTFFPPQGSPDGSAVLLRARMALFVEHFLKPAVKGKATAALHAFYDERKVEELLGEFVEGVKGLEGGLGWGEGGGKFFGGSKEITLVEVMIAPLLLRLQSYVTLGLFPRSHEEKLQKETPAFWAWMRATCDDPAILDGWDEDRVNAYLMVGVEKKKKEFEAKQ